MEKAAVTAVCWIPRGRCKIRPAEEADEEEMRDAHAELSAGSGAGAGEEGAAAASNNFAGLEEFDMDKYDDEEKDGGLQFFSVLNTDGELAREKDPYMTGGDPDSESDDDAFYEIKENDNVFVAVSCEEENCMMEMYVYDDDEVNMYVHHEIMLSAYPLCVEWLTSAASAVDGNFGVVGAIDHTIQIWDLNDLDPMEPVLSVGPTPKAPKGKTKKKSRAPAAERRAHEGPVLCLNGSTFNRSVLASGSADETLKVWDVAANSCVHTYTHHSSKVQCVRWHPTEAGVMLSAAFDRRLGLLDVRQTSQVATTKLPAEAESAIWSQHRPFECMASVDNGGVACFDVRKVASKAPYSEQVLWSLQAHDVACTAVQDSPLPNVLLTCGLDGVAKVWNAPGVLPTLVMEKNLNAGPLFTCASCTEEPRLVCFGGSCPVMWDLTSESVLTNAFKLGGSDSKVDGA
mmetsp:Transcript_38493/g.99488  ORF Transcript_38493/g.99488 Transcript_38493/m.99488 type:complete len:458 (-) Transcript_38493:41-1414(-)